MRASKTYYIYIATNKSGTLYVGVTSNLITRIYQHKRRVFSGFTSQYNINKLIYFEEYMSPEDAIVREKQLKGWRRSKKMNLIKSRNPEFKEIDLV